jgi:outer membrane protein
MLRRIIALFLCVPFMVQAQSNVLHMSYQDAVALALQQNYDILIARKNVLIADKQNTLGNAGFLPKIDLTATGSLSNNKTRQEFSSGLNVDQSGVKSNNINSGAYLTWTIFDGLKMFATKERLSLMAQQSQLGLRLQMENTIEAVSLQYYQIVKQEQLIKGIWASMEVSDARIQLAEKKLAIGSGSNVEVLQAKLDRNAQAADLILQTNLLKEYKNNLLLLCQREVGADFTVDTAFAFETLPALQEITQQTNNSNTSLLQVQKGSLIAQQSIKELRAQTLPRLGLTSNYLFTRSSNAAGFTLLNQNLGLNMGFSFSWNLFNGWTTHNQVQSARLQYSIAQMQIAQNKAQLMSRTQVAYIRWMGDQQILAMEEANIKLAEQSLNITKERLKLGLGNYLEAKESQSTYQAALTRLVNARYNVKQSEIALQKLRGGMIKEMEQN